VKLLQGFGVSCLLIISFGVFGEVQAKIGFELCESEPQPTDCVVCFKTTNGARAREHSKTATQWRSNWFTDPRADKRLANKTCTNWKIVTERPELDSDQTPSGADPQELAKKLSNPVASLISVPFQSNFDFGMGSGSGWRYTLNFQPVIPVALSPKWNMISRTILPIIHQHNVVGTGSQSGLGDLSQSLFFSPTDSKRFVWVVGPQLLIPTATNDFLGTGKFVIGPTLLILKQEHGWTYGALTNHVWSVAGSDTREDINSTFLQPFLSYNTKDAWTYSLYTESSYDWVGNHWSIPIHVTISRLIKFGNSPVSIGGTLRCWATSPAGGAEGCGFRITVTPLFPK